MRWCWCVIVYDQLWLILWCSDHIQDGIRPIGTFKVEKDTMKTVKAVTWLLVCRLLSSCSGSKHYHWKPTPLPRHNASLTTPRRRLVNKKSRIIILPAPAHRRPSRTTRSASGIIISLILTWACAEAIQEGVDELCDVLSGVENEQSWEPFRAWIRLYRIKTQLCLDTWWNATELWLKATDNALNTLLGDLGCEKITTRISVEFWKKTTTTSWLETTRNLLKQIWIPLFPCWWRLFLNSVFSVV